MSKTLNNDSNNKTDKSSDSSDSSDSDDVSDSSSDSSSSCSNSGGTQKENKTPATKFSVMRSDCSGLRMKIIGIPSTTIHRNDSTSIGAGTNKSNNNNNNDNKSKLTSGKLSTNHKSHRKLDASAAAGSGDKKKSVDMSSSSCCSACTESDSDSSSVPSTSKRTKQITLRHKRSVIDVAQPKRGGVSCSGSGSNDDGSDDDESSDCSKKVGPKKKALHLTTVIGAKNAAAAKCSNKTLVDGATSAQPHAEPLCGDAGSSSDMELPALVSAAIQRVESCSDGENSKSATTTQYTSSLLRDFMAKTQWLGSSSTGMNQTETVASTKAMAPQKQLLQIVNDNEIKTETPTSIDRSTTAVTIMKRKRGRPKKLTAPPVVAVTEAAAVKLPNSESPDSGITSTPHSPVQCAAAAVSEPIDTQNAVPNKTPKTKAAKKRVYRKSDVSTIQTTTTIAPTLPKLNIASLEKSMYATERVLYPPRRKKRDANAGTMTTATSKSSLADDMLDPIWRKIDINKKFRRPSVSGYKSDGGTVCSKILAAQSNYGNYGSLSQRMLSGYKSDYSCKSKRSGYKSDYSVKAKSCGYRSDCGGFKHRKKVRRKRRMKMFNSKAQVNDMDILQLAGLSLGQSEESSRDSLHKSAEQNLGMRKSLGGGKKAQRSISQSSSKFGEKSRSFSHGKEVLNNLCERVTKRLSGVDTPPTPSRQTFASLGSKASPLNVSLPAGVDLYKRVGSTTPRNSFQKSGLITCRRSSAVSHCSSRSGCSRSHFRKRRRKRLKSQCRSESFPDMAMSSAQLDLLISSFSSLCSITDRVGSGSTPSSKDRILDAATAKQATKRTMKKRKGSEMIETAVVTVATTSKRRHKKVAQTQSPDDHKLPLKKRHYLMTPGEKSDCKNQATADESHGNGGGTAKSKDAHENESIDRICNRQPQPEESSVVTPTRSSAHKNPPASNTKMPTKAVTPKKRHLLETPAPAAASAAPPLYNQPDGISNQLAITSVVSLADSSSESLIVPLPESVQLRYQQQNKKSDIMTRKKNRLEGLVSKIMAPVVGQLSDITSVQPQSTSQHSPVSTASTKSTTTTISSSSASSSSSTSTRPSVIRNSQPIPPPGVFEPTIDLELQIPYPTLPVIVAKTEIDSPRTASDSLSRLVKDEPNAKGERVLESLLNKTGGNYLLKKKRKKQNRTGFPTVRKKKKMKSSEVDGVTAMDVVTSDETTPEPNESSREEPDEQSPVVAPKVVPISSEETVVTNSQSITEACDRVPKTGEAASTFIERNSRPRLSVVSLERLQGKVQQENDKATIQNVIEPAPIGNTRRKTIACRIDLEQKKRGRDSSAESIVLAKKYKKDIAPISSLKPSAANRLRKIDQLSSSSRDVSSDNEPLINFVNKDGDKQSNVNERKSRKEMAKGNISLCRDDSGSSIKTRRSSIADPKRIEKSIKPVSKLAINKEKSVKSVPPTMPAKPTQTLIAKPTQPLVAKPTQSLTAKPTDTLTAKQAETLTAKPTQPLIAKPTPTLTAKPTQTICAVDILLKENKLQEIERKARLAVVKLKVISNLDHILADFQIPTAKKAAITASETIVEVQPTIGDKRSKRNVRTTEQQKSNVMPSKTNKPSNVNAIADKSTLMDSLDDQPLSVRVTKQTVKSFKMNKDKTAADNLIKNKPTPDTVVVPARAEQTAVVRSKNDKSTKDSEESDKVTTPSELKQSVNHKKVSDIIENISATVDELSKVKPHPQTPTRASKLTKEKPSTPTKIGKEKSILPKLAKEKLLIDQAIQDKLVLDLSTKGKALSPKVGKKKASKLPSESVTAEKPNNIELPVDRSVTTKPIKEPEKLTKNKIADKSKNDIEQPVDNVAKEKPVPIVPSIDILLPPLPLPAEKPTTNSRVIDTNVDYEMLISKPQKIRKERRMTTVGKMPAPQLLANQAIKMPIPDITADENYEIKPFDENYVDPIEDEPLPVAENPVIAEIPSDSSSDSSGRKILKLRKKHLPAGLFSDYFKESVKLTAADKLAARSASAYAAEEHPRGLLPPPLYCETFFRRTIRDFQLPYDLWWAHENEKLPGRNAVPSWNYRKIRTNVYCDVRANPSSDQPVCSCKPESACGDDCLNRLMYTECSSKTCPCAEKCQNTKIQRHIVAPGVERFMTENKGWGVKAKQPIKKGTYIIEYVGEIVTEREFKDRMATLYIRDTHHYCLNLDGGLVIDGHRMGSDARFVNHSCLPNCEMQKWSVNGLFRMALFAARVIEPGEELTYDYNFSLFNPAEGQPCRCDTPACRGVIGGKSQRIKPMPDVQAKPSTTTGKGRAGRPRKNQANKNQSFMHTREASKSLNVLLPTAKEQTFIKNGHCFLLRNLRKVRRLKRVQVVSAVAPAIPASLTAHISALRTPRNIRTRGVTIAEHDPEIEKTARIAGILRELCEELSNYRDASGQYLLAKLNLPSKRKCPQYYDKITKPIDMSMIEVNVEKGVYKQPSLFDEDVLRLLGNAVKYNGIHSAESNVAQTLLNVYTTKKQNVFHRLATIVGELSLVAFIPNKPNQLLLHVDPNEDIIGCICGLFKDEGIMIQCSKCLVWQHTECTGADTSIENYLCERCDASKVVDYEIAMDDYTDEGYRYYMSLLRGDLQIRQTDTVYVLRDIPIEPTAKDGTAAGNGNGAVKKHTYKTIGHIEYSECDIFRVERLWKDDNGKRFVFGHHYLRPHETYHEPTRKFYQNEVVRVPLYEVVPIELIMGRCWVLDPTTFCKGRPVDSEETHIYICELRVDKAARMFSKISKQQYPVCTKSYAFRKFEQKLKITRNYLPHEVNLAALAKPKKKKSEETNVAPATVSTRKYTTPIVQLMPPPPKTLNEKRVRLESHLSKLMTKLKTLNENIQPLNLSYLLTGRGTRRRANTANVPQ